MLFSNTFNNISHVKLLLRDWKDEQMLVRKFLLFSSKQKRRIASSTSSLQFFNE